MHKQITRRSEVGVYDQETYADRGRNMSDDLGMDDLKFQLKKYNIKKIVRSTLKIELNYWK